MHLDIALSKENINELEAMLSAQQFELPHLLDFMEKTKEFYFAALSQTERPDYLDYTPGGIWNFLKPLNALCSHYFLEPKGMSISSGKSHCTTMNVDLSLRLREFILWRKKNKLEFLKKC